MWNICYSLRHYILLLLSVFTICSCDKDDEKNQSCLLPYGNDCSLTIDDASVIYNSAVSSSAIRNSKGCLSASNIMSLDWHDAIRYHNTNVSQDNVEVPFKRRSRLYFFLSDGINKVQFLDYCQKILVVRDSEGRCGVFLMTIIADKDYTRTHRKTDLNQSVHNDGRIVDYSGLIVYSHLTGKIVRADRYRNGVLVSEASIFNMPNGSNHLAWHKLLSSVMGRVIIARSSFNVKTKGDSDDTLDGWWNRDSSGIVIDSSVCVVDSSNNGNPFDPFDDLDDGPEGSGSNSDGGSSGFDDIDPGGGGGSNQSGNSGSGSGFNQYNGVEHLSQGDKNIDITYGPSVTEQEKTMFRQKLQQLQSDGIFSDILSTIMSLDNYSDRISILALGSGSGMPSYVSGQTYKGTTEMNGQFIRYPHVTIELNVEGHTLGYLEEFFHAQQFLVTERTQVPQMGDIEFEAKIFMAKMLQLLQYNSSLDVPPDIIGNIDHYNAIWNYFENRTEDNRVDAMDAFLHLGYMGYNLSYEGSSLNNHLDELLTTYYTHFERII